MTCLKEAVAEVGSKTDGVAFLEYLRGTDPGVGGIIAERIFSSVNSFVFGEGMNLEQIVGTAIEVIEEPRRYDISLMKRRIKDFSNFSQIFTKCFNNDLLLNYLVHSVSENDIVSLLLHIIQSDEDYLSIRSYDKVHKIENMVQERVRNRVLKLVTLLESFVGVEEKP
ncbi:unnamed protein product [Allacma fusca]|uniref:Uncharacterized protein n=1 Tax=Allacma fusca TaxID=39272 RepID=A0A8J2Q640_9HEXA|nr:unnamed protein product [Allacma fusca]